MANLNRIILIGKLTNDPEVRFTVEGIQVAKFQVNVERFAQEGAPKQSDTIDIIAWRKLAEVCGQSLKKDKPVLIEGRIQVRTFENESGVRKWATEVVARSIKTLWDTPKPEAAASKPSATGAADEVPGVEELPEEESDLPF